MRPLGLAMLCGLTAAPLLAWPAAAAPAGQVAQLHGIDASHWQGTPDWSAAAADGVDFAFIKATEGRAFVDEQYSTSRSAALAAGIPVGAYHFARPDSAANDAVKEADHFVATAALTGRNLLPVLDIEDRGALAPKQLRRWAKAWLGRVQERLGVKAIIYTSPAFWRDRMGNSGWFADNGYRLWVAHWGVQQPDVPARNWGGRGWTLWQYDACGNVAGFKGCVDRDLFAGSRLAPLRIKNNR